MYTYPSATINHVTFTARRFGQFPTITYATTDASVTAGHEIVVVASDLSNITIYIKSAQSTNQNIADAINNWDGTFGSLYPRDLISVAIAGGHTSDTNTAVSATALTGAASVPPPVLPPIAIVQVLSVDPVEPVEGQVWYNTASHLLKFYNGTAIKTVAVV